MSFPIGIFDSGVGGLSVARVLFDSFDNEIIYFADSVHLPYGNKSEKNILRYSLGNTRFLKEKGAKLVVVACNTSAAIALDSIRKNFPDRHVLGVVEPGAAKAIAQSVNKKIGVIGTVRTIESRIYVNELKRLNSDVKVFQKACPLLVPLIEEGFENEEIIDSIINEYLKNFVHSIDTLLLGCTHYPLLTRRIAKLYSWLKIIDSAEVMASGVSKFAESQSFSAHLKFTESRKKRLGQIKIYTNDVNEVFERLCKHFFPGIRFNLV